MLTLLAAKDQNLLIVEKELLLLKELNSGNTQSVGFLIIRFHLLVVSRCTLINNFVFRQQKEILKLNL